MKVPHDLFKLTTADANAGGPSSTRPYRLTKPIGLTEFGPPKTAFSSECPRNQFEVHSPMGMAGVVMIIPFLDLI
jgi:hypothetical protein